MAELMTEGPKGGVNDARKMIGPPVIFSGDILGKYREVVIQHGQEQYRLRLTSSNKLILIK